MADEEFHEADEFGYEENESEDEEAEEGVASNFANNIAVENAHGGEKGSVTWGGKRVESSGRNDLTQRARRKSTESTGKRNPRTTRRKGEWGTRFWR
jgi:hypothetical protein